MATAVNPTETVIEGVKVLYNEGQSLTKIGDQLGVSAVSIRNWLLKANVSLRTRSESQIIAEHDRACESCGLNFDGASSRHKTCRECTPDNRWRTRYRFYGITKPQFDQRLKDQNNTCPLCLVPFKSEYETTVDHCHTEGHVRGILCRGCNMVISRFENPDYVARVANYLKGVVQSHG